MDIIRRNFLRLLRAGAFNENEAIEPMSRFKWDIIFHVANIHDVVGVVFKGMSVNNGYADIIPQDIIAKYREILYNNANIPYTNDGNDNFPLLRIPDAGLSHMCNRFLNYRLSSIREKEPLAEDSSIETLNMLDIIVQATERAMTYGLSLATILRIGMYLRNDGDKVDYIKLEKWLRRLNILRMAQLEGSILIDVFGFEQDEIPFVNRIESSAGRLAIMAIEQPIRIDIEEWKINQKSTIFITNNSKAMMKTVKNCMRYFFFAPLEATSNFLHRFVSSLSNLEE